MVDPPGDGVAWVPAAPTGLRLLPPRDLASRLPAGMLAIPYSRVRPEPTAADRTRSLPGLWHGDASWSPCGGTDGPRLKSECLGHFWQAGVGKFSRAPKYVPSSRNLADSSLQEVLSYGAIRRPAAFGDWASTDVVGDPPDTSSQTQGTRPFCPSSHSLSYPRDCRSSIQRSSS